MRPLKVCNKLPSFKKRGCVRIKRWWLKPLISEGLWLHQPWAWSPCESDKEVYYFKEVVMLGPMHFISHWTWTIAFYVFLFLGLVLNWRQCQGRVAPGKALSRPWWEHSACGMNMNSWSILGCPPPWLIWRALVEAGEWGWAAAFLCFYCLCKAERNTCVLGNKENGSEVARRLICRG